MMPECDSEKLSTTRLAKRANVDSRKLFERLLACNWLTRTPGTDGKSQYQLTAKGEFEGGEYRDSDKFGRYIVWPETLVKHRLLTEIEEKYLTATALGRSFGVPGRLVNLLLADLGWIEAIASGWQLTSEGKAQGGQTKETSQGATYVCWPTSLPRHQRWQQGIAQLDLQHSAEVTIDGRPCGNTGLRLICNWLYLHRISYACQRQLFLSNAESVMVDIYLPQTSLVIEYWGYGEQKTGAGFLKQKMHALERLKKTDIALLELRQQDLTQFDEILARALIQQGLKVY